MTLAPLRVARDTRCPRSFHAPSLPPPRGALRHSGHRPGSGHGPADDAAGRGLRTGLGTSPAVTPAASTAGLGLNSLAFARSPLPRSKLPRQPTRTCARNGQSGPREDRRGSSRRPAALFCPRVAGFGWGRARRCGTRQDATSPTPPPIRVRATPSLTRTVQIRPKRRISNAACPSAPSETIFRSKSVAFGPMEARAPQFCPKNGLRRRCKAACNSLRVSRKAENSGPLAFRRPPARRGLRAAPGTVPTAQARSGLGSCLSALRGYDFSISGVFFNSPQIKPAPHATPPSHLRAREIPDLAARKWPRHYAAPEAAAAEGAARLRRAPFFSAPRSVALYGAQGAPRAPLNSPERTA